MLPEPTLQPLGLADHGGNRYRNRFRRANLALEQVCQEFTEVYPIDVAATLAAVGAETLLDDGLTDYVHFGSPGWLLQRADSEKAAVHHLFPDCAPLADMLGGDPYRREKVMSRAHTETLISVLGIKQKKCVIVDLDGVLWPGVLAETGTPFAWSPDISGPYSFIGLYFGLHEALKTLKERGIILAAVSKNDESVVRDLWRYPAHYPHHRLLTPDDFATWRVNWHDKATNIQEIAQELGFAADSFVFIDDHPVERERVSQQCAGIEIWGEDPFSLRRRLLTDPRLMPAHLTRESGARTQLVKAQIDRNRLRASAVDESAFLASLEVVCTITRLRADDPQGLKQLERIQELFFRTTQFNATGAKFTKPELMDLLTQETGRIYAMSVRDRFADHGLAGAAVVIDDEIRAFAMSCRIIGLKAEQRLLEAIVIDHAQNLASLVGRIFETPRNNAARNLYRDGGFEERAHGEWRIKATRTHKLL